jgi:hypothetical protein
MSLRAGLRSDPIGRMMIGISSLSGGHRALRYSNNLSVRLFSRSRFGRSTEYLGNNELVAQLSNDGGPRYRLLGAQFPLVAQSERMRSLVLFLAFRS